MNCDDVIPNPSERETGLNASEDWEVSRESTISKRVFPGRMVNPAALKIGHARKCNWVMLRDLYQVMIGREDADPA